MNDAVAAMERFAQVMERSIEAGVRSLVPEGRTMVSREWVPNVYYSDGVRFSGSGIYIRIRLDDGTVIEGYGPAKLEALLDAETRLRNANA